MLGKIEGKKRRRWLKMTWLDSIIDSMDTNFSRLQDLAENRGVWHAVIHGVAELDVT